MPTILGREAESFDLGRCGYFDWQREQVRPPTGVIRFLYMMR